MCGIAGIIRFKNERIDGSLIRKMTDSMAHRGPDADGFFEEEAVALGHRRLSIIDLSTAANQPFADSTGRYMMVFNGEMYNYNEVKSLLGDYPFQTTGDTEVLIAAYAKWGTACLEHFRGMFAFAVWDRQKRELFMARDRLGVKPLYYFINDDYLVFASEVRAVLATGMAERKIDQRALIDYFSYQSVSSPYSIIEGVQQLEAGCMIRVKNGKLEKELYWDVASAKVDFDWQDGSCVRKRIRELLLQSVKRRLVSDVPVGAFLSGGIDSSVVVGLMAEAGDSSPNTFNISFEEKEYDESEYAEIIARKFNANHTRILLKPTVFLDELQDALDALDTPSGDGINTYVVSQAIRRGGMTVALSGVGGDELFAGYPFFAQYLDLQGKSWLWKMPGFLRRWGASALATGGDSRKGRMSQVLRLKEPSIDEVYPLFRQILSMGDIKKMTSLVIPEDGHTAVQNELAARSSELKRLPLLSQVSVAEYLGYTQHTLLKDTDQMSMAASLEVREPFFDQDLVEFLLSVPDDLKKPVYPKSLLVESVKPLLPDEIVFRRKQGFLFPWNSWLKGELRAFCDLHIKNMAEREFIRKEPLLAYWNRFLAGDNNVRWAELWLFVVLDYWMEKNQVS